MKFDILFFTYFHIFSLQVVLGKDSIPGYDKVGSLASYLVSLRDQTTALSNSQASIVITLWNSLAEYDRRPTTLQPRYKKPTGRFNTSKTAVAPGVESTRRCFLGQNQGPAQWPNCNRYVEAVVIQLCDLFPTPLKRPKGSTLSRWTQILQVYKRIRDFILGSPTVMAGTRIQLLLYVNCYFIC